MWQWTPGLRTTLNSLTSATPLAWKVTLSRPGNCEPQYGLEGNTGHIYAQTSCVSFIGGHLFMLLLLQRVLKFSLSGHLRAFWAAPGGSQGKELCFKAFYCVFLHIRVSSGDRHLQIFEETQTGSLTVVFTLLGVRGTHVIVSSAQTASISLSSFRKKN